ncbi:hypothetical protein [Yoonia sp. 2307UL14-13]|uniref:hypothetical protein n=1 Tax=Yoonia sp. 2307UL14-13 TaxID=3126506 RepID=UPI0030AC53C3
MFNFPIQDLGVPVRDLSIRDRLTPEVVFDRRWLFRCRVKILVVTDSFAGGFGMTAGFHLGQALAIVNADPWSHIQFSFAKAHRGQSGEDDVIDNFRFDDHDLDQYSQIWMFGIERTNNGTPLSETELRAVSEFMDGGGGVFATGDHEDLGNSMCAEVPRVRSMRRWWYSNPGPNGEPVAPAQSGADRHDTLVGGGTQTDPDPQMIRPRLYQRTLLAGSVLKKVVRYPHPVLCGPSGILNYLPDHMHEGLCEVPDDLGNSWTFDGQEFTEYPDDSNGVQVRPEVIAYADNNVNAQEFGVLGAYDGHRADVGRVVVDATWHHWFNINTMPYANASDPAHPSYTPATVAKWREIQEYFRNVAVWLARPSLQRCIRNGGWIRTLGDFDIAITFQPLNRVRDHQLYFWQLGTFAKDALGRSASRCQLTLWILDILFPREFIELENPFIPDRRRPEIDPPGGLDFEEFETVALGAAIHGALETFGDVKDPEKLIDDDGAAFEKVLRDSSRRGVETFVESFRANGADVERMLRKML